MKIAWMLTAMLGFAPLAVAQTSQPTPSPTTQSVAENSSTPRGAMKVIARALAEGDATKIASLFTTESADEAQMVQAMADAYAASVRLRKSAGKVLDPAKAKNLAEEEEAALNENFRRFDSAKETIKGDEALVVTQGEREDMNVLKQVGGVWKLTTRIQGNSLTPAIVAQQTKLAKLEAKLSNDVADDLLNGKIKTYEELTTNMQAKYMAIMREAQATRPATQPAK